MATPRKVNPRLIRLLYLLVKDHMTLQKFEELVKASDQNIEIDEDLARFISKTALHLTEWGLHRCDCMEPNCEDCFPNSRRKI